MSRPTKELPMTSTRFRIAAAVAVLGAAANAAAGLYWHGQPPLAHWGLIGFEVLAIVAVMFCVVQLERATAAYWARIEQETEERQAALVEKFEDIAARAHVSFMIDDDDELGRTVADLAAAVAMLAHEVAAV
jgi:membrane protein YdbS with pleckstrin-like domain